MDTCRIHFLPLAIDQFYIDISDPNVRLYRRGGDDRGKEEFCDALLKEPKASKEVAFYQIVKVRCKLRLGGKLLKAQRCKQELRLVIISVVQRNA